MVLETRGPCPHRGSPDTSGSRVPGSPQLPCSHQSGHSPPLSHTAVSPSHMPLGRHCLTGEPRSTKPSSHSKLRLPPTGWDPSLGVYMPFSKETGAGQRTAGERGEWGYKDGQVTPELCAQWVTFAWKVGIANTGCPHFRSMPVKLLLLEIG